MEFGDLRMPLVTNAGASLIEKGEDARAALIKQLSNPVRWLESIERLIAKGVNTFVEVGPGKVLSGLVRQISRDVQCLNVEDSTLSDKLPLVLADGDKQLGKSSTN
jgi:[acyl-carrier-protein] S-malonyltransferase